MSGIALKAKYETEKSELEKKFLILVVLLKKTNYNTKISSLATKIELTTV